MTKQERLQRAWHHFDDKLEHLPSSTRQACEWAVAGGLLEIPEIDPYDRKRRLPNAGSKSSEIASS
jgi:hypothetical protein